MRGEDAIAAVEGADEDIDLVPPAVRAVVRQLSLEHRVRQLEQDTARQAGEVGALRADVSSVKEGLASLNRYLSGDRERKEDRGKLGELMDAITQSNRRQTAVLGAVGMQILALVAFLIEWAVTHR